MTLDTSELPPEDKSGSVIPVTGAKAMFIAILTVAWKYSQPRVAAIVNLLPRSVDRSIDRNKQKIIVV